MVKQNDNENRGPSRLAPGCKTRETVSHVESDSCQHDI